MTSGSRGPSARFDARFLRIGIHPGGGHTWLLDRAVGPQAAAAMNLFGERLDGERAAAIGLAWECVPDDGPARPGRRARVPRRRRATRSSTTRVKATLRQAPWQPSFDDALRFELEHQVWSLRQPEFTERIKAPRRADSERRRLRTARTSYARRL